MSLGSAARKGEESGRKHAASGAALTYENGIHHAKKAGFLSEDKINAFADGFVRAGGGSAPRSPRGLAGKGRPVGNLRAGRLSSSRPTKAARPKASRASSAGRPPEVVGYNDGASLSSTDADIAFHDQEYQDFPQFRAKKLYPNDVTRQIEYETGWERGVEAALNNPSRNGRRRTRKHAGKGKRRRNGHCASPRSPRYDASCDVLPGGAHDRLNRHVAGTSSGNIRDMRLFDAHWAAKGGHSPKGSHIPPRALTSGQHAYMDRAFYTPGLIGEAREQARHTSSQLRANKRKARLVFRKKR